MFQPKKLKTDMPHNLVPRPQSPETSARPKTFGDLMREEQRKKQERDRAAIRQAIEQIGI